MLRSALRFLLLGILFSHSAVAQDLTDAQIIVISSRLSEVAKASWELGTRAEAVLELNATTYSVFSGQSLPPPSSIPDPNALSPVLTIAKTTVTSRQNQNGPQPLVNDGSAADPASIGVSVLIASLTGQDQGQIDYLGAAREQVDYLFSSAVPKSSDGAISHRVSQLQLWSDSVYMVPPFLAYYGMATRNRTTMVAAYTQIRLYRNNLRDPNQGMWRHVRLGATGNDQGFWSTGNGWAAAGILRVLATMKYSEFSSSFKNEQADLGNWLHEIHSAMYARLDKTNLFPNYADQSPTASGNFYDASSTALLASTVYRAAVLLGQHTYLPHAERSRKTLSSPSSNSSSDGSLNGYQHFTADGWLTPVVDPHAYGQKGTQSPEGQAFVVLMHAAWKDWVKAGSKGASAATSVRLGCGRGVRLGAGVLGAVSLGVLMGL